MALVCLCTGVDDRRVRRAIAQGAATVDAVGRACGAGTGCGGCHPTIERLIDEQRVSVVRSRLAS